MSLFARATQGLWLSPVERSWLKFLKGLLVSAILSGITAAYPLVIATPGAAPDWSHALAVFMTTTFFTLWMTLDKYVTAHLDPAPQPPVNLTGAPVLPPPTGLAPPFPPHG